MSQLLPAWVIITSFDMTLLAHCLQKCPMLWNNDDSIPSLQSNPLRKQLGSLEHETVPQAVPNQLGTPSTLTLLTAILQAAFTAVHYLY